MKYYDIDFQSEKQKGRNERRSCLSFLLFCFFDSCLLAARARSSQRSKKEETKDNYGTVSRMIVAASCGTKNNNASLQSNN